MRNHMSDLLLLGVPGEASHVRTTPLGQDSCWVTTRRYDEPMAGPHRRYASLQGGLGGILAETPPRVERVSRTSKVSESR